MKKISILLLSMLVSTIGFTSCKKDIDTGIEKSYKLDATSRTLSFTDTGATAKTVTITAENVNWDVKKNDEADTWYRLSTEGTDVTVEVDDNVEREARSAKFTVTSDVESIPAIEITVEQSGGIGTLVLSEASLVFEQGGGEQIVGITGVKWIATVTYITNPYVDPKLQSNDWITITPSSGVDGSIIVGVTANEVTAPRTATISVTNAAGEHTVDIFQNGIPAMPLTDAFYWFPYDGETQNQVIISNAGWTISSDHPWLTVTKTDELGFAIIAAANDGDARTATVTFTNSVGSTTAKVYQEGAGSVSFRSGIASFWGTTYGYGTGNFSISIFSGDKPSQARVDGYYLSMDFVTPQPSYDGEYLDIAPGTYEFSSDFGPYKIMSAEMLAHMNNGYRGVYIIGGRVVVEGDHEAYHMEFELDLAGGKKFKGTFDGASLGVKRNGWEPPVEHDPIIAGNITGATVKLGYGDDYFKLGNYAWLVEAYSPTLRKENGNWIGDGYMFTTQLGSVMEGDGAYLPDAVYMISNSTERINSAMKGYEQAGKKGGTWLYKIEGGVITYALPAEIGTITTTHNGTTHTFVIHAVDVDGAAIDGTFTGDAIIGSITSML